MKQIKTKTLTWWTWLTGGWVGPVRLAEAGAGQPSNTKAVQLYWSLESHRLRQLQATFDEPSIVWPVGGLIWLNFQIDPLIYELMNQFMLYKRQFEQIWGEKRQLLYLFTNIFLIFTLSHVEIHIKKKPLMAFHWTENPLIINHFRCIDVIYRFAV